MQKIPYALAFATLVLTGCGDGDRAQPQLEGDDKESAVTENSSLTEPVSTGAPAAGAMAPQAGSGHSAQESAGNGGGSSAVGSPGK